MFSIKYIPERGQYIGLISTNPEIKILGYSFVDVNSVFAQIILSNLIYSLKSGRECN